MTMDCTAAPERSRLWLRPHSMRKLTSRGTLAAAAALSKARESLRRSRLGRFVGTVAHQWSAPRRS